MFRRVRARRAADRGRCRRDVVRPRPAEPCRSRSPRRAWRRRRSGAGSPPTCSERCAAPGTPPRSRRPSASGASVEQPVHSGEQVGDPLPEARRSLERQQVVGQLPAVAGIAEHPISRHHHVVEVHLAELVDTVHRAQRAHRDAGGVQVDEERRDALMLGGIGRTGPGEQDAPLGELGEAGPHLLPVDHPVVAVAEWLWCSARPGRCPSRARRSPGTRSPHHAGSAAPSRRPAPGGRTRSWSAQGLPSSSTGRARRGCGPAPPRRPPGAGSADPQAAHLGRPAVPHPARVVHLPADPAHLFDVAGEGMIRSRREIVVGQPTLQARPELLDRDGRFAARAHPPAGRPIACGRPESCSPLRRMNVIARVRSRQPCSVRT